MSDQDFTAHPARRLSAVRVALVAAAVVLALIFAAVAGYVYVRWSRNQPPHLPVFPGAVQVIDEAVADGQDHQQYTVLAPVSEVEQFYVGQDLTCQPQYASVTMGDAGEPVREGYLYTRCLADRSLLGFTQYAVVLIQPRYDPAQIAVGEVVVDVQRYWGA